MKTIYSKATAVRVQLGSSSSGSGNAVAILKQIRQGVPIHEVTLEDCFISDDDLRSVIRLITREHGKTRPGFNKSCCSQKEKYIVASVLLNSTK
jgi:hypothetical protein